MRLIQTAILIATFLSIFLSFSPPSSSWLMNTCSQNQTKPKLLLIPNTFTSQLQNSGWTYQVSWTTQQVTTTLVRFCCRKPSSLNWILMINVSRAQTSSTPLMIWRPFYVVRSAYYFDHPSTFDRPCNGSQARVRPQDGHYWSLILPALSLSRRTPLKAIGVGVRCGKRTWIWRGVKNPSLSVEYWAEPRRDCSIWVVFYWGYEQLESISTIWTYRPVFVL